MFELLFSVFQRRLILSWVPLRTRRPQSKIARNCQSRKWVLFFFTFFIPFRSSPLLACPPSHGSSHFNQSSYHPQKTTSVKLGLLLTCLSALYQLSSFSSVALSVFPSSDLQCRASICIWERSWQWREQGQLRGEDGRWEGQNRVTLYKDGAICQRKRVRFETDGSVIQSNLT